ncbi:hypothetical protein SUGI_0522030 [Cryptomeria japonica]|nr:hypothetical protein SUGI_0522030 [Cryptomeria japonica]
MSPTSGLYLPPLVVEDSVMEEYPFVESIINLLKSPAKYVDEASKLVLKEQCISLMDSLVSPVDQLEDGEIARDPILAPETAHSPMGDCWLGEEPLASSPSLRRLQDATKSFFGERVNDYFSNNTWRALEDCSIDHSFLLLAARELQKLLVGTFLPLLPREDRFIWKWDPSGDFSIRTAYNNLLREPDYTSI